MKFLPIVLLFFCSLPLLAKESLPALVDEIACGDLEDLLGRHLEGGESRQVKVVLEALIADIAGVLPAHKHRSALEPGQALNQCPA